MDEIYGNFGKIGMRKSQELVHWLRNFVQTIPGQRFFLFFACCCVVGVGSDIQISIAPAASLQSVRVSLSMLYQPLFPARLASPDQEAQAKPRVDNWIHDWPVQRRTSKARERLNRSSAKQRTSQNMNLAPDVKMQGPRTSFYTAP